MYNWSFHDIQQGVSAKQETRGNEHALGNNTQMNVTLNVTVLHDYNNIRNIHLYMYI